VGRVDLLELDAHADAPVAPRDAALAVDVFLGPGHAEPDLDLRTAVERARRPDGDPSVTEVEGQRRGDRVAEPVLDRDTQHHTGPPRRLKLSGNRCGASDGRMCCTALYSLM